MGTWTIKGRIWGWSWMRLLIDDVGLNAETWTKKKAIKIHLLIFSRCSISFRD